MLFINLFVLFCRKKRSDKHLSLFFGSQSIHKSILKICFFLIFFNNSFVMMIAGTAEDFARTIAKDAKAMGFKTAVIDLEDYSAVSKCV